MIISESLIVVEEEKLLRVLRDHKDAIGWSLADLKGIHPSMYASDLVRRWSQALSGSIEKTQSDHEVSGKEGSIKVFRCEGDLSHF